MKILLCVIFFVAANITSSEEINEKPIKIVDPPPRPEPKPKPLPSNKSIKYFIKLKFLSYLQLVAQKMKYMSTVVLLQIHASFHATIQRGYAQDF